jgi:hypothetical protein
MKAGRNITIAISALLLISAYFASTFWWVFIVPLPVLLICQWVAQSAAVKDAERFFGFTDLAYYLIVGAVIGLGAQYLSEIDRILQQDAEITFAQASAELPEAREEAQAASQLRRETSTSLENIPPEVIGDCVAQQMTADLMDSIEVDPQRERDGLLLADYPPGCELPLSVVDAAARATSEAISANNRVRDLSEIVERGPNADVASSDLISPEGLEWILFRLFPALVLCGVMLKVGKTTLSIRKSA